MSFFFDDDSYNMVAGHWPLGGQLVVSIMEFIIRVRMTQEVQRGRLCLFEKQSQGFAPKRTTELRSEHDQRYQAP